MVTDLERLLRKGGNLVSESSLFPWVRESVDNDKMLIYERNRVTKEEAGCRIFGRVKWRITYFVIRLGISGEDTGGAGK